ncbi:MAG: hypothetical protein JWM57_16 [Phycisphaerales bacterium]|nr:hypothetical protein [Phycisphaerales bacterium]
MRFAPVDPQLGRSANHIGMAEASSRQAAQVGHAYLRGNQTRSWPLSRPGFHGYIILGVALLGVTISAVFFVLDRASERSAARADLERHARERAELLSSKVASSTEVLRAIASLYEVRGDVSRAEFTRFVAGSLGRQPELLALSWTPRVTAADVHRLEAAAQGDGLTGFHFVERAEHGEQIPVAERREYFPVYFIAPVARNELALGFDLHSNPIRAQTLDEARDSGRALATPPIHLVQEMGGDLGFLVFLPIYHGGATTDAVDARRSALAGYATAVYRIPDLVTPAFKGLSRDMDVAIEDRTNAQVIFHRASDAKAGAPLSAMRVEAGLNLAGRNWAIVLSPTPRGLAGLMTYRPWIALLIGLATTGLITGYISMIVRRQGLVERRVEERTHALSIEVAERRRAQDQALLAEQRYRTIYENCIEGIFQTTLDGHYISVNPALTNIYGYDLADDLIRDFSDIGVQLYVDPGRRRQFVQDVQRDGIVTHFESQIRRRDGSIIWISENARAVRDGDGVVAYYEGTVEDVTERRTAEKRLRRLNDQLEERVRQRTEELDQSNQTLHEEVQVRKAAEALAEAASRAKSVFLANVSHEIRTPMNAILGYTQLLRRDPAMPDRLRDTLDTIAAGGDHLLALIEELIDLSKMDSQRGEPSQTDFDLCAVADEVAHLLRHQAEQDRGLALTSQLHLPRPCMVRGDESGLRKVLINLVSNGIKYTDAGEVAVRVAAAGGDVYTFEVTDTGVGIPQESVKTIFEPFVQGESGILRGGSGLGLAIARRQVAVMGGELGVDSCVGQGSRFFFSLTLPRSETAVEPAPAAAIAFERPFHAMVVDDVPANCDIVRRMIEELGGTATSACDVEAAITLATTRRPDVVLTDIVMPDGGGLRLTTRLMEIDPTIPVMAITALHPDDERITRGPWRQVLSKPVRLEQLATSIAAILAKEAHEMVASDPDAIDAVVEIPADMLARLVTSADMGRVADITSCLAILEQHGAPAARFAQRLRGMLKKYDVEGITRLLNSDQVQSEPSLAEPEVAAGGLA